MDHQLLLSFLNSNGSLTLDCTWKSVSSSIVFTWLYSISSLTKFTLKGIRIISTCGHWYWLFRWFIHSCMIICKWLMKVYFHISVKSGTTLICFSSGPSSLLFSFKDLKWLKLTILFASFSYVFALPVPLLRHSSSWESSNNFHIWLQWYSKCS